MIRYFLVALVLALAVPGGAPLASDLAGGLARCAAISDSLQRLTCYDALAGGSGARGSSTAPTATSAATTTRAEISGRCQGITKKGAQCKRNAKPGSSYCYQHGG